LLTGARFGDLRFATADEPMLAGPDPDDVLGYERTSQHPRGLGWAQPSPAAELTRQVRDSLRPYASPDGVIVPSAAWLVTARAL
jgi:hypothetical protein